MANRHFNAPVQSLWHKPILVAGVIELAADASVSSSSIKGASVAKTGTGEYTITLEDQYSGVISLSVQAGGNVTEDIFGSVGAVDVSVAKTIEVLTVANTGAAADVTAATQLYVTAMLSNSSVD